MSWNFFSVTHDEPPVGTLCFLGWDTGAGITRKLCWFLDNRETTLDLREPVLVLRHYKRGEMDALSVRGEVIRTNTKTQGSTGACYQILSSYKER